MKLTTFAAIIFNTIISSSCWAVIPESGLWWNPTESGRGYTLELQDDGLFVAYYSYQPDGTKSAFYTSFGRYDSQTSQMRAPLYAASDGQCFGCSHRSPKITDMGEAKFEFSSPVKGTILLPGNINIPIERMPLVGQHQYDPLAMLGVWTIVDGDSLYFGEALWFRQTTDELENGFMGHRVGSARRLAIGRPTNDPELPPMLVLLDSSASYYTAYAFDNSYNRWIGRSWTYPKTGALSGPGLPSVAHRLIGNTHAEQSTNVTGTVEKNVDTNHEQSSIERHQAGMASDGFHSQAKIKIGELWYDESKLRAAFGELESENEQALMQDH